MLPRLSRINFFDDIFDDSLLKKERNLMKTDIKETEDEYILEIDIPGCKKENIKIDLEQGYLNVKAEVLKNTDTTSDTYIHKERFSGSCQRSYYIGNNINEDDIKASFINGILEIHIPKKTENEDNQLKKYIEIKD